MILSFGEFEIDPEKGELRKAGEPIHTGPRTLALLHLLASNHERLVTRDEIIEAVWDGRIVSDSAVSTAIKEARKAVGDDGSRQEIIRTVHGVGFRCVADVRLVSAGAVQSGDARLGDVMPQPTPAGVDVFQGRPSIAVLPFRYLNPERGEDPVSDAIPAELISALSRLRWLAVTARGSSFRFRGAEASPQTVRDLLGVRYCLTGLIEEDGKAICIDVELCETETGNIIWAERFSAERKNVHEIRAKITAAVISAFEIRIPLNEASLARVRAPENLDAWAQYHLGLQHMYRFNRHDNEIAKGLFARAIEQAPSFARAHAGLSFAAFQIAFMHYGGESERAIEQARKAAEKSLELDFLDPFANYCMGRVSWLDGDLGAALGWLDRSLEISPNFAQAHYLHALMDALAGESDKLRPANTTAMSLSPLDPLFYAMLGTQAMSYINERNFEEGRAWAERGARAPGSHYLLAVLAAVGNQLAGDAERAAFWVENVRRRRDNMTAESYFQSFPYADTPARVTMTAALTSLGF